MGGEYVAITGMVLLELLRGFLPPRAQDRIMNDLAALELIEPTRDDYVEAARLANTCRQAGVQLGSVDALLAQLAISRHLEMLTTDRDFENDGKLLGMDGWEIVSARRASDGTGEFSYEVIAKRRLPDKSSVQGKVGWTDKHGNVVDKPVD